MSPSKRMFSKREIFNAMEPQPTFSRVTGEWSIKLVVAALTILERHGA